MSEADSWIAWLERRLQWADRGTLPLYVATFKDGWQRDVGPLETIPQDFKDKVSALYERLKQAR